MLRLQDTKTGLAEAALGEGGGVKLHKLSVKELRDVRLFCLLCAATLLLTSLHNSSSA